MTYLPPGLPVPQPSPEDGPFWDACRQRRLSIRHCKSCQKFFHPPTPSCPHCGSVDVDWRDVSGTGTVFSYTVAHHAVHKALKGHGPYNVVVVQLDGADDVRLVSNLVDAGTDDIRIGEPVSLFWDAIENGMFLPRFRRAAQAADRAEDGA